MDEPKDVSILVKWCGKEYHVTDLNELDTVAGLRHEICKLTQVRPERQKLLNLKHKGVNAADDVRLGQLQLKANYKLMMVGSLEADIDDVSKRPDMVDDVLDDFEDIDPDAKVPLQRLQIYVSKIKKRIREYEVKMLNAPRAGKRLLVLDIDYTLFDHRSVAETGAELMRPHLHEFLTAAYAHYDIVIWSATGMRWIEEKMRLLGVTGHPDYKISFYLDWGAMISVYTTERGVSECKPLGVIWGKYPQWSAKNTIMFDDIRRNFLMNPQSGLRIRAFRRAHTNRATDRELVKLKRYLCDIAVGCENFVELNHSKWESYEPPMRAQQQQSAGASAAASTAAIAPVAEVHPVESQAEAEAESPVDVVMVNGVAGGEGEKEEEKAAPAAPSTTDASGDGGGDGGGKADD